MNEQRRSLIADAVARRREQRAEEEATRYEEWLIKEATRRRVEQESIQQELGDGD